MGRKYASGKHAFGFCDRCGFRVQYRELKTETVAGRPSNIRVCPTCWDTENPQEDLGKYTVDDPQALRDARPDPALQASRELTP